MPLSPSSHPHRTAYEQAPSPPPSCGRGLSRPLSRDRTPPPTRCFSRSPTTFPPAPASSAARPSPRPTPFTSPSLHHVPDSLSSHHVPVASRPIASRPHFITSHCITSPYHLCHITSPSRKVASHRYQAPSRHVAGGRPAPPDGDGPFLSWRGSVAGHCRPVVT